MCDKELIPLYVTKNYITELLNDLALLRRGDTFRKLQESDPQHGKYIEWFYRDLLKYAVERGI